MECDLSDSILQKSKLFLSNRKNSNELVAILLCLEDVDKVEQSHILAVQLIFTELHQKKQLSLDDLKEGDAELKYRKWLLDGYNQSLEKLLCILSKSQNESVIQQVLTTLLLFLEFEKNNAGEDKSPVIKKLADIIQVIVNRPKSITLLIQQLKEYITTKCDGQVDDFWKSLALVVQREIQPDENTVNNVIKFVDSFPKDKSKSQNIGSNNKKDAKDEIRLLRVAVTKVWSWCLRHHKPSSLKPLLITLLEQFMPLLNNPIYLTDFLVNTLNSGGSTSLLALQGIYLLILKHNIDYPNIFGKLYTMLQPDIFRMKYKPRFFYLLDLFLTSTHLPEQMVASFVKRLSRLALRCTPHDILILLPFIGNLLIRHPGLKRLINYPAGGETVDNDPFIMEESDPMKTCALRSSLWEVKSLQQHVLPSVSRAAMFINEPLPSVEWDLANKLETTSDQIFDKERRKKMKTMPTTFERPSSLFMPRSIDFGSIWSI